MEGYHEPQHSLGDRPAETEDRGHQGQLGPCSWGGRGAQVHLLISSALVLVQLSDWWLKTAYLQFRQPVVIYSSPGVMLPKQDFMDLQGQLR